MTEVIKRSGKKEQFDVKKINKSVKKAFVDAGLSIRQNKEKIEAITKDMVKMAKEKTQITTKTIRDSVLQKLKGTKKAASDAWMTFDKKYKKG